jgi:hypothetical protein
MSDEKTWFVIGDKDFALLNDEEFAQVWAALSVVMRKRALTTTTTRRNDGAKDIG